MYTQSFKDSLFDKIESLPLLVGLKEFSESEWMEKNPKGKEEKFTTYSRRLLEAAEKHEKENKSPEKVNMVRLFVASLLSELDEDEINESVKVASSLAKQSKGLNHCTEKELSALVYKALKGETGGLSVSFSKGIVNVFDAISKNENIAASCRENKMSGVAEVWLRKGPKEQGFSMDPKDPKALTLTLGEAVKAIAEGKAPFAPKEETPTPPEPTPTPEPAKSTPAKAPAKGKK